MSTIVSDGEHSLSRERFPLSPKYDPQWVFDNEMGPNALWLTEYLLERLQLDADKRVMDLGCGTALSSIFLAREFGVQVWATDLWIHQDENWRRVISGGRLQTWYIRFIRTYAIFLIHASSSTLLPLLIRITTLGPTNSFWEHT